jgi:hypothetical protein
MAGDGLSARCARARLDTSIAVSPMRGPSSRVSPRGNRVRRRAFRALAASPCAKGRQQPSGILSYCQSVLPCRCAQPRRKSARRTNGFDSRESTGRTQALVPCRVGAAPNPRARSGIVGGGGRSGMKSYLCLASKVWCAAAGVEADSARPSQSSENLLRACTVATHRRWAAPTGYTTANALRPCSSSPGERGNRARATTRATSLR